MKLSQKIADAVAERTGAEAPGPLIIEEGPHRLTLELGVTGPVGVSCDRLEFTSSEFKPGTLEGARAWAERLSSRVTYLLEPLSVQEADGNSGVVLLRSKAPNHREGRRTYFQASIDSTGRFELTRRAFDETQRQQQGIPCQLTIETLERLADDLAASVS